MRDFVELMAWANKITNVPKTLSFPQGTLVVVGGKQFKLIENAYVSGTLADYAVALKPPMPDKLRRLNLAFDALNCQMARERSRL